MTTLPRYLPIFVCLVAVAPVAAEDVQPYSRNALACYSAASTASMQAVDACSAAASAGDPHALYLLAERSDTPQQRIELLRRAARADYPPALVALGDELQERARVFEAEQLYFRAADLDYGLGMQRVVQLLLADAQSAEDFERIRLMLLAPARDGYGDAAYDVALMFRDGIGGEADIEAARHWMFEAATTGHPQAQYEVAMAFMHTEPAQGLRWLVKAARLGLAEAMYELAVVHTDGVITPRNFDEALYWVHEAIMAGHPDADRLLAEIEWRRANPGIKRSAFHLTPHDDEGVIEEVLPASASQPDRSRPRQASETEAGDALPSPGAAGDDTGDSRQGADAPPYIVDWQIELNTGQEK